MTTPAPPKRPRGRPPTPVSPVPAIDDGMESRLRFLIGRTIDAAERRLDEYEDTPTPTPEQTASIMKTGTDLGVLLGHVRRHTESVRNAGKKLSLPVVTAWLREQSDDIRAQLLDEFSDTARDKSVLG